MGGLYVMAIWLCNNKGLYDRDVKDEELLGRNLFLCAYYWSPHSKRGDLILYWD